MSKSQLDVFRQDTVKALQEKLDSRVVKQREQGGVKLDYVEGWYIQDELNRIFGFGNWDQEIIAIDEVLPLVEFQRNGVTMYRTVYRCVMRLTVTPTYSEKDDEDGDVVRLRTRDVVVREDVGTGSGNSKDPAMAVDSAIKEAATDALKRAAKSFGNRFGLALYDKSQANVKTLEETQAEEWCKKQHEVLLGFAKMGSKESVAGWIVTHADNLRKKAKIMPAVEQHVGDLLTFAEVLQKKLNAGEVITDDIQKSSEDQPS